MIKDKSDCYVLEDNFSSLHSYYKKNNSSLRWSSLFVMPSWLETWWKEFGREFDLLLLCIHQGNKVIGIAPLKVKGETASIIGSSDVSDFVDFITLPGSEREFFSCLFEYLSNKGISCLDIKHVHPKSSIYRFFVDEAKNHRCEVYCKQDDVSLELDLPACWDDYMAFLSGKQRHEVRRKIRRLQEAGSVNYRTITGSDEVTDLLKTFFWMFSESREDKKRFLTTSREAFFRSMVNKMSEEGLLELGLLELDDKPVSIILTFDYQNKRYLYNSGYDPKFRHLSVGLLLKIFCIKESIEKNKTKFDFLKGNEAYKYRLGAREVPLYRCQIIMTKKA
ncbi:MAG: GNAT family N-acetyltransferase [bacterium]